MAASLMMNVMMNMVPFQSDPNFIKITGGLSPGRQVTISETVLLSANRSGLNGLLS